MNPKSTSANPYDHTSEIVSPEAYSLEITGQVACISPNGKRSRPTPTPPNRVRKDGVPFCSIPAFGKKQLADYFRAINTINIPLIDFLGPTPLMVRLDVPDTLQPREWKAPLSKLWNFLRPKPRTRTTLPKRIHFSRKKLLDAIWMIWRLEPNRHWSPHYHLVIGGIPDHLHEAMIREIRHQWCIWCGQHIDQEPDPAFLIHGTWGEAAKSTIAALFYQGKGIRFIGGAPGRSLELQVPRFWAGAGRSWGICGKNHIPRCPTTNISLNKDDGLAMKRALHLLLQEQSDRPFQGIPDLDNGKRLTGIVVDISRLLEIYQSLRPARTPPATPPSPTLSPDDHDHPSDH